MASVDRAEPWSMTIWTAGCYDISLTSIAAWIQYQIEQGGMKDVNGQLVDMLVLFTHVHTPELAGTSGSTPHIALLHFTITHRPTAHSK